MILHPYEIPYGGSLKKSGPLYEVFMEPGRWFSHGGMKNWPNFYDVKRTVRNAGFSHTKTRATKEGRWVLYLRPPTGVPNFPSGSTQVPESAFGLYDSEKNPNVTMPVLRISDNASGKLESELKIFTSFVEMPEFGFPSKFALSPKGLLASMCAMSTIAGIGAYSLSENNLTVITAASAGVFAGFVPFYGNWAYSEWLARRNLDTGSYFAGERAHQLLIDQNNHTLEVMAAKAIYSRLKQEKIIEDPVQYVKMHYEIPTSVMNTLKVEMQERDFEKLAGLDERIEEAMAGIVDISRHIARAQSMLPAA